MAEVTGGAGKAPAPKAGEEMDGDEVVLDKKPPVREDRDMPQVVARLMLLARGGWTGGQYSMVRAALAVAVMSAHGSLVSPAGLVVVLASTALLAGWRDVYALAVLAVLAILHGDYWAVATAGLMALVPMGPYGSAMMYGQVDPGSKWSVPLYVQMMAWVLMVARMMVAARMLHFAMFILLLLFVFPRMSLGIWLLLAAMGATGGVLATPVSLTLLAMTFSLTWLPRAAHTASQKRPETVFYDGHCGLCHSCVRFVLAEDRKGVFLLAPLQSELFASLVDEATRKTLPDSIVVVTNDRRVLTQSTAIAHMLKGLGGLWSLAGALLAALPLGFRDGAYGFVAGIRHRLFAPPPAACPRLPAHLRARFPGH